MSVHRWVMARSDDGAFVFCGARDDASSFLIPYIMDAFQFVGVDPGSKGFFVLPLFWACDSDCSDEYAFWENYDVLIVACTLIVVWSS